MLSVEEALAKIIGSLPQLPSEPVPVAEALGRVLSTAVQAGVDLPGFDNSAVDGYALRAEDVSRASAASPSTLRVIAEIAAGVEPLTAVTSGCAARIFTGSPLPKGADAVVMQEDTRIEGQTVFALDVVKPYENVRLKGEDVKRGDTIAAAGERLSATQLALLSACGVATVAAARRPAVALLSTGSELCEPGEALPPGRIYESNRLMLACMARDCGAMPTTFPIVEDTRDATIHALKTGFKAADVVITSGGVSVGDHDHVKAAFEALGGQIEFWRVSMRPGKPFVFGRLGEKLLFGLPGNPISAFVTFLLLARPALLRMQGAARLSMQRTRGVLAEAITNHGDRRHFVRVMLDEEGSVRSAGRQGSHMIQPLARANGLLDLSPGQECEAGASVEVLLW